MVQLSAGEHLAIWREGDRHHQAAMATQRVPQRPGPRVAEPDLARPPIDPAPTGEDAAVGREGNRGDSPGMRFRECEGPHGLPCARVPQLQLAGIAPDRQGRTVRRESNRVHLTPDPGQRSKLRSRSHVPQFHQAIPSAAGQCLPVL